MRELNPLKKRLIGCDICDNAEHWPIKISKEMIYTLISIAKRIY
jgi:hypothetical protein